MVGPCPDAAARKRPGGSPPPGRGPGALCSAGWRIAFSSPSRWAAESSCAGDPVVEEAIVDDHLRIPILGMLLADRAIWGLRALRVLSWISPHYFSPATIGDKPVGFFDIDQRYIIMSTDERLVAQHLNGQKDAPTSLAAAAQSSISVEFTPVTTAEDIAILVGDPSTMGRQP
eukprot:Skav234606  [mRNA]  locus=scaffold1110:62628:64459:- [translate_table: standard]